MSLLEKATLITTPTAHSNGTLHSIKGGAVADFDVVRGSAATRVNAEGLIEDISVLSGELVTNNSFDTDSNWNGVNTNGVTISNGSLNFSETTISHNITQGGVAEVGKSYKATLTISNYIKGSVRVLLGAGGTTQEISANGTFTLYGVASINTTLYIQARGASNTTLSIDNISVKEVIDATNIPRIDYTTGEGAVLLEPQSTNLLPYSEDFTQWSTVNSSVDSNDTLSPNGSQSASKLNTTSVSSRIQQSLALSGVNTISIFVKYAGDDVTIRFKRNTFNDSCSFDVSSLGVVFNSAESGITSYNVEEFANDWHRVSCVFDGGDYFQFYGDVTGNNGSVYIWGAQAETLTYATSYIPTSGAIATRLADSVTGAGDTTTFNSTEGVLYAEIAALSDDLTFRSICLNDGTNLNSVNIRYRTNSNRINAIIKDNNGANFQMNVDVSDITQFNKIALKYKSGDVSMYINGTEVATNSTNFSFTSALNNLSFDRGDNIDEFYGKTKALAVFNEALTDSELECLTKI